MIQLGGIEWRVEAETQTETGQTAVHDCKRERERKKKKKSNTSEASPNLGLSVTEEQFITSNCQK